jgi:tRNA (guanosine-2'-O-)-methyltransferase
MPGKVSSLVVAVVGTFGGLLGSACAHASGAEPSRAPAEERAALPVHAVAQPAAVQASPPHDPEAPPAQPAAKESATAVWSTWSASGGESPVTQCVKDATDEICFDGVDNDCDGLVDEGCPGYRTTGNALQFTLAWKLGVDLDLEVVGPAGEVVSKSAPAGAGLVHDKACSAAPKDDCPDGKVENVYLPDAAPVPKGRYTIRVRLADTRGQTKAHVPFFLGGKVGSRSFLVPAFVPNKKGETKTFAFDVD